MPDTFHNLHNLLNFHHKKIGLFDSGIGGVSILNELTKLPIETFVYVADTAHLPYGTKSPEFLLERAIIITRYLQDVHGITTIIVACHTSAATTLPTLKNLFPDITFINPLPLTTYAALLETKTNHVGVLATPTSIRSGMHKKLLLGQNLEPSKELSILEQACPLFVDLIENNGTILDIQEAIETYTKDIGTIVDTLILGCTHYPFIADQIQQALPHTKLISAASCIAEKLKDTPTPLTRGIVIFKTSGTPEKTEVLLEKFFNKKSVSSYAVTQLETLYR